MRPLRRALLGAGLAALLLAVHIGAWRPARNLLVQRLAHPAVVAVETARSSGFEVGVGPSGRELVAVPVAGGGGEVFRAPAGMEYLAAALVLIAAFPRRRLWLWLWGAHVALGLVAFAGFVVGVGWAEAGFALNFLVRVYAAPAASLLALAAAFAPGRRAMASGVPG